MIKIIGYAATFLAMSGAILNARKNKYGFVLWIVANTTFIVLNARQGNWHEVILWAFYDGVCIYGFIKWKKE